MRILLLLITYSLFAIDLELVIPSYVLETKQIHIPNYPEAFNPSLVRFDGKLLLSFRLLASQKDKFQCNTYLVWLNEDFEPISTPQVLNLRSQNPQIPPRIDDTRLLLVNNRLHAVYSDCTDIAISRGGFRMYIAEVDFDGEMFTALSPERLSDFEGQDPSRREKNWVPFDYHGELLLAYSLSPHKILRPIYGTESCETISTTNPSIPWSWGELRGGTPAIKLGDQYLSFFHSQQPMASAHSNGQTMSHYFMGAYTFSGHPPFQITSISPDFISGKYIYTGPNYKPYWGSFRGPFPCGILSEGQFLYVTYGRQNREIWVMKLDRQKLLETFIPVKP